MDNIFDQLLTNLVSTTVIVFEEAIIAMTEKLKREISDLYKAYGFRS